MNGAEDLLSRYLADKSSSYLRDIVFRETLSINHLDCYPVAIGQCPRSFGCCGSAAVGRQVKPVATGCESNSEPFRFPANVNFSRNQIWQLECMPNPCMHVKSWIIQITSVKATCLCRLGGVVGGEGGFHENWLIGCLPSPWKPVVHHRIWVQRMLCYNVDFTVF